MDPSGRLRGFFVAGTDTDAGKTFVCARLARLLGRVAAGRLSYLKPVQTGCTPRLDGTGAGGWSAPDVDAVAALWPQAKALACFEPPCSPHLAASLAGEELACRDLARRCADAVPEGHIALVEGAGGCWVPLNSQETMLDLMLCLGLPVVLVAANRLGCLNHAMLSVEVLQARGLEVAGIILNRTRPPAEGDAGLGSQAGPADELRILEDNEASLQRFAAKAGVPLLAAVPWQADAAAPVPELEAAAARLSERLARPQPRSSWPTWPSWSVPAGGESRESMAQVLAFDRAHLWHPYTSALKPLPVREAVAARGTRICLADGTELVDGMSSWWCAVHGYGNPALKAAMARQVHEMSHVMFGGLSHRPAVALARRLLDLAPAGMRHVFFADSGSVAVEVALKMAVQYQIAAGHGSRRRFLTPLGGYHGDTQGAMSVCDPVNGMHTLFSGLLPKHYFMERPSSRFDQPFDPRSLDDARRILEARQDEIACVVLEPIVQGAGGMWFYHPRYLEGLAELCRAYGVLLVLDEIATGFGRTGKLFASEWAGVVPDIMCVGKALTGGMMTGGAVLASGAVAEGIEQAGPAEGGGVLMHGPTFMANPLFCATACQSLDLLMASPWQERVRSIEAWLKAGLAPCLALPGACDVRVLGAIGVVEARRPVDMARLQDFFVSRGVWIRPFNRNVYLMPPFVSSEEDVALLCSAIRGAFEAGLC